MHGFLSSKNPQTPVPASDSYLTVTVNESWIARCSGKINVVTNTGVSSGTGFHIGNGYFLTAGHCISVGFDKNSSHVAFEKIGLKVQIESISIHGGNILDFAIVKLKMAELPFAKLCLDEPLTFLGENVLITHHPHGEPMKLSRGIITLMDNDLNHLGLAESQKYFRYTPATMKGSSGAPVALETLEYVIGVHTKGDEEFQGHHAAISILKIHEYLKSLANQQGQSFFPQGILHFAVQVFIPIPVQQAHNNMPGQNPLPPQYQKSLDIRGDILPSSNMPPPPASKFTKSK